MIRAEPPVAIVITSFGSIVGRVVRKEPLESLYQIEDSGGIAIPFTIADLRRSKACKYSCDARLVLGRREPARMSATSSGTFTPTGSPQQAPPSTSPPALKPVAARKGANQPRRDDGSTVSRLGGANPDRRPSRAKRVGADVGSAAGCRF